MRDDQAVGRRGFIVPAAASSVGALAAVSSARAAEPAPAPANPPAAAPAAPLKVGGNAKYDAVLKAAREKLYPRCLRIPAKPIGHSGRCRSPVPARRSPGA